MSDLLYEFASMGLQNVFAPYTTSIPGHVTWATVDAVRARNLTRLLRDSGALR